MSESADRRIRIDVLKLLENGFNVSFINTLYNFDIKFNGPMNTPYEGGMWNIRVHLSSTYPFSSPIIYFTTPIYHPNICMKTGLICMNLIEEDWTPIFDLSNIFEIFLPQLLTYPDVEHPLNLGASAFMLIDPEKYRSALVCYTNIFALKKDPENEDNSDDDSSTVSELSDYED